MSVIAEVDELKLLHIGVWSNIEDHPFWPQA